MSSPSLPPSLQSNPDLDRWIRFETRGQVRVAIGKVEIGQGIVTAIAQIAAEELDVGLARVAMLSGDTSEGPDELYTTSSLSMEVSGASVRLVCAEARRRMLDRLAQRLNCGRDELSVADGAFLRDGQPTGYDYWRLAPEVDLSSPIAAEVSVKDPAHYSVVGTSVARLDLPAKLSGAAFLHDAHGETAFADLVHARTLRQPQPDARLEHLDTAAIERAAKGDLQVIRLANFVAFVSDDEAVVERAAAAAPTHATWSGLVETPDGAEEASWLEGRPSTPRHLGEPPAATNGPVVEATYSRPYVAHAAIGPSCAIARFADGRLSLWSHGQGMHPLRRTVADALGLDPEQVSARHLHGPGCYGHNGADDVTLDAAIIARALPGRAVRVQWRREEEFAFEPVGTAMLVRLSVELDPDGRPCDWTTRLWSGVHVQRPGSGGGRLLAASALPDPPPPPVLQDPPEARGGGATRNAVPLYNVGKHRIEHHLIADTPVRTSALRGLGALPNVFAIESMLDDLAARGGQDPLAYRLALLDDPRARAVLERVGQMSDWAARGAAGSGQGLGIGFGRYKNRSAYAGIVAAVRVDEHVHVEHVWCAVDAGLVVNPDGVRNQVEGGIVQATSWTIKEQVRLGPHGVVSQDWDSYPILRFSETPAIDVSLLPAAGNPPLGVGECSVGPTAGAIGNAVAHALGARIQDLPLTRERIARALLA